MLCNACLFVPLILDDEQLLYLLPTPRSPLPTFLIFAILQSCFEVRQRLPDDRLGNPFFSLKFELTPAPTAATSLLLSNPNATRLAQRPDVASLSFGSRAVSHARMSSCLNSFTIGLDPFIFYLCVPGTAVRAGLCSRGSHASVKVFELVLVLF